MDKKYYMYTYEVGVSNDILSFYQPCIQKYHIILSVNIGPNSWDWQSSGFSSITQKYFSLILSYFIPFGSLFLQVTEGLMFFSFSRDSD
jgi:hypothetical protein